MSNDLYISSIARFWYVSFNSNAFGGNCSLSSSDTKNTLVVNDLVLNIFVSDSATIFVRSFGRDVFVLSGYYSLRVISEFCL